MADTEAVTRASAIAAIEHVAQNNCGSREREAIEMLLAAPAAVAGKAVHQLRTQHCADWYDGRADHGDGGGSYEERTLYTAPQPSPVAQPDDAALLHWMSENYLSVDFAWGDPATTVLVIEVPKGTSACGDLRTDVLAAMAKQNGGA